MLSQSVTKEIDRLTRRWVWGSNKLKKKTHLVKWACLCKLLKIGGAGLKRAATTNMVMLAKLGWRKIQNPNVV